MPPEEHATFTLFCFLKYRAAKDHCCRESRIASRLLQRGICSANLNLKS